MMQIQDLCIHQNFAYITSWHKISDILFSNDMFCVQGTYEVSYGPSNKLDKRSNNVVYGDYILKLNFWISGADLRIAVLKFRKLKKIHIGKKWGVYRKKVGG